MSSVPISTDKLHSTSLGLLFVGLDSFPESVNLDHKQDHKAELFFSFSLVGRLATECQFAGGDFLIEVDILG